MAICEDKLYHDVIFWLPENQTLPEATIRKINKLIISQVGSEDSKYAEVLCKSLEANARKNQIEYQINSGKLKKEKVDQVELEYFQSSEGGDMWDDYVDSLKTICPLFGYNKPYAVGIMINPGKKLKVTDCPDRCYRDDGTKESFFLCDTDNDDDTCC